MPSVEKQIMTIPFAKGLSQREDPRWLGPGALITGVNAVHPKSNIVQKRPGFLALARAGVTSVPGLTRSLAAGRRLGQLHGSLLVIGADTAPRGGLFPDALWTYDETAQRPVFKDRVPEVYAFPSRAVTGGDVLIWDMDTAVCNGYAVHVWIVGAQDIGAPPNPHAGSGATDVYYQVESAATGEVVTPARSIGQATNYAAAAKLVVCGTNVVMTYVSGNNDNRIFGLVLDCTQPWVGWTSQTALTTTLPTPYCQNGAPNYGAPLGVYDVSAVLGDTTRFCVAYEPGTATTPTHIAIQKWRIAGGLTLTLDTSANIDANDSVWTADKAAAATEVTLQSITVRADAANNEVAVAYGWNTNPFGQQGGSPPPTYFTRVSIQLVQWASFGTVIATALELLTAAGGTAPIPNSRPAPQTIAIERVGTTAFGATGAYKVMFSDPFGSWCGYSNGGLPITPGTPYAQGSTGACIASYLVYPLAGAMLLAANQARATYGVRLASRILVMNGIGYVIGYMPSDVQGTYFLFADDAWADDLSPSSSAFPLRLVATFAPRLASGLASFWIHTASGRAGIFPQAPFLPFVLPHLVANPNAQGGSVFQTLLSVTQGQASLSAPAIFAWDFASPRNYQMGELGENTGIACGCPSAFDGSNVFEFGFPYYPFIVSLTAANGGQLNPAGIASPYVENYIILFEKRDARGQRHMSARGITGSIDLGGHANQKVQIVIPTMGFTGREKAAAASSAGQGPQGYAAPESPVTIRVYRTAPNGSTFYNVDPSDVVSATGLTIAQANTANAPSVTLTDTGAFSGSNETGLTKNELLYSDGTDGTSAGSILDNFNPPAFQALIVHKNRFWGIDGTTVWYSDAFVTGEGSGFNELLTFSVDDGPGFLTALASLDDKLIIFKRDRVLYVTGEGPTDAGASNDLSAPQRVASDVGCVDWRSVVVTPQGVHFMSDSGLRMLTRDLQVVPVVHVEDVLAANPAITSAMVHPTLDRVLWTANTDDTSSPRAGVGIDHDYVLDSWLTSTSSAQGAVSAEEADALVGGQLVATYHQLGADGTIYREAPSSFTDAGLYVPMTLETAWIKTEGIANFARYRRLLVTWENKDPHQLSVFVAFDYGATYYLMGTVSAAKMASMATPLCQELFALPRQRAEAVRFKIVDAADPTIPPITGQGPLIVALELEYAAYTNRRAARLPGSQRA